MENDEFINDIYKDIAVPHEPFDILITMNVYAHIGFDDAERELKQIEEL